jgi:hypothetical protein
VTWDFDGAVDSYTTLAATPTDLDPTRSVTDAHGDRLYNVLSAVNVLPAACTVENTSYCSYRAYLDVVVPSAPTGVTATQAGDQFQVGWVPDPATAALIDSSTVTATPVGSAAPVVTATVSGSATSALAGPLAPETTYDITVVSTDAGGTSPASSPVTVTTAASAIAPAAPAHVSARWTAPESPADTLSASWSAALGGDSPVDQYQITVGVRNPGKHSPAPVTQTVSGSILGAVFAVDDTPDWKIQVRAHDTAGWGPWSAAAVLRGT